MSGQILVTIAFVLIAVILISGIISLFFIGFASRQLSNRLMWFRVGAQLVAFIIAMLLLYFGSN